MYWKKDTPETLKFYEYVRRGKPFIVFDTETTGLKKDCDRIIQFSAARYEIVGKVYQETNAVNFYIRPPFFMEDKVIEIHGITNEFLADKRTEEDVYPEIEAFMDRETVICGYNIKRFDIPFLNQMAKRNGSCYNPTEVVDIYTVCKENIYPGEVEDFSLKLCNVAKYFRVADGVTFHSAMEDISATWAVGAAALKKYYTRIVNPEEKKEKVCIISMSLFKKSSSVNRIYVDVFGSFGYGKFYYDIRTKGWVTCGDDSNLIQTVDMDHLQGQAEQVAIAKGFKSLDKFEGNYHRERSEQYA